MNVHKGTLIGQEPTTLSPVPMSETRVARPTHIYLSTSKLGNELSHCQIEIRNGGGQFNAQAIQ